MISTGNHVKFAHFLLLAHLYIFTSLEVNYQFHLLLWPFFFIQCIIKQLLHSVFVISRLNKILLRVTSQRLWLGLLTPTLTILVITKASSSNCLSLPKLILCVVPSDQGCFQCKHKLWVIEELPSLQDAFPENSLSEPVALAHTWNLPRLIQEH